MRLHLRKQAAMQIKLSQDKVGGFPPDSFYEAEIIDAAGENDPATGLGRMVVVAADLLEQVRKADPSYGLVARDD